MTTAVNIVAGGGLVYFDPLDPTTGALTGELLLAQSESLDLAGAAIVQAQIYRRTGGVAVPWLLPTLRLWRSGALVGRDITDAALGLWLPGTVATVAQTSTTVSNEALVAAAGIVQGRRYQLGVSSNYPAGRRGLTNVVVHAGSTPFTLGTDYTLDAAMGVTVVVGGGIANTTALRANYTVPAASWGQVAVDALGPRLGALRFLARPLVGAVRDLYAPAVVLTPTGDWGQKVRDKSQRLGWRVDVLTPTTGAALLVNGRPA